MLGGSPTLDFAAALQDAGMPFVFASGYTDNEELAAKFPGVALVGKPYAGNDLVERAGRRPALPALLASGGA